MTRVLSLAPRSESVSRLTATGGAAAIRFAVVGLTSAELHGPGGALFLLEQDALSRYAPTSGKSVVVVATLEPCGERMRGPPGDRLSCAQRIIEFSRERCRVAGVVAGAFDGGAGIEQLTAAGIPVALIHGPQHPALFRRTPVVDRLRAIARPSLVVVPHAALDDLNRERLDRETRRANDCDETAVRIVRAVEDAVASGEDAVLAARAQLETMSEEDAERLRLRLVKWRGLRGQPLGAFIHRLIWNCVDRQWEEQQRRDILDELRRREVGA